MKISNIKKVILFASLGLVLLIAILILVLRGSIFADTFKTGDRYVFNKVVASTYDKQIRLMPNTHLGYYANPVYILSEKSGTDTNSKIFEIVNNKTAYRSTLSAKLTDLFFASDVSTSGENWIGFIANAKDLKLENVVTASSLSAKWNYSPTIKKIICQNNICPDNWDGNARLFSKDSSKIDTVILNYPADQPLITSDYFKKLISARGNGMTCAVSNMVTTQTHAFWGGECPLDDAFVTYAPIIRDSRGYITKIDYKQKREIVDPKKDWSNRMVRQVLISGDKLIVSGEGWVGRTDVNGPGTNWDYPIWNPMTGGSEYIYATNLIKASGLVLLSGFDKKDSEAILRVSKDNGAIFSSFDNLIAENIASQGVLKKNEKLSAVRDLYYNLSSGKVFINFKISNTTNSNIERFVTTSTNISSLK